MPLSILSDDDVRNLLENLTPDELEEMHSGLKEALHDYSNGMQGGPDSMIHQPERISTYSARTGATTLYMPSSSPVGQGVKVITLSSAQNQGLDDSSGKPVVRPTGAITLFNPDGTPAGILHASTLTAFRTALASLCLVLKRNTVRTITVFGCGEQAYWHVRLALMMRGGTVRTVNVINRRFSPACTTLLQRLHAVPADSKAREGWAECSFGILTPSYNEYARLLKDQVRAADVIFCCTPSTEALFDAAILTSHEGRRKGRLIVAIGSYTPDMRELPLDLLRQATHAHEGHFHFHKHAVEGGVIVVDTVDGVLKEAGEVIDLGLEPKQLVELGELVMLRKIAMAEEESSETSSPSTPTSDLERLDLNASTGSTFSLFGGERRKSSSRAPSPRRKSHPFFLHRRSLSQNAVFSQNKRDDHLARWMQGGNVIYKSVGLGLMDLTVGMQVIRLARDKGIGSYVDAF